MRNLLSIWFGKLLSRGLQASGRHGAALPGLIVERLYPGFLHSMLEQLPEGVIIVSGTNGKTTTTKMIAELLKSQDKRVLTNRTGGNFVRGVISTLIQAASLGGKLKYDVAVLELDEAYAAKFVNLHHPRAVVALNVTRDQLDRFGELDTTAKLLERVVEKTIKLVVLNDDDNRTAAMRPPKHVEPVYFGASRELAAQFPNDEQLYGSGQRAVERHQRLVELTGAGESQVSFRIGPKTYTTSLLIDGQHNGLNAAAALVLVIGLYSDIDKQNLISALGGIRPAFGRGEVINYKGRRLILQLVKNPASFGQALHVLDIHKPKAVAIIINDNHADGRDVSWLWDVDFAALKKPKVPILTAGLRAYDMAVRLKYDQIEAEANPRLKKLLGGIETKVKPGQTAIIYTTYTAMLAVRRLIGKQTKLASVYE